MEKPEERQAMADVTRRLQAKFPNAGLESIESLVATLHHEYDGLPGRGFIPVLVERDAAARLAAPPPLQEVTTRVEPARQRSQLFTWSGRMA